MILNVQQEIYKFQFAVYGPQGTMPSSPRGTFE